MRTVAASPLNTLASSNWKYRHYFDLTETKNLYVPCCYALVKDAVVTLHLTLTVNNITTVQ